MSAPTEMELRRPEPEITPEWACKVAGCKEPVPADVEDQPHCESCHVSVCEVHVVTRAWVHLCPGCAGRQSDLIVRIAAEMTDLTLRMKKHEAYPHIFILDLNEAQAACERWMKEIGEVL